MFDIYLLTHPESTTFVDSHNSLLKFGYNPIIVNGYTHEDNVKPNTICFLSFKDKIFPKAIEQNKPFFYIEDDTIINEPLPELSGHLVRVAWWGLAKDKNKNILCKGSSIVYFNTNIFNLLKKEIDKFRPQHIDMFFSRFCIRNNKEEILYKNYNWNEKLHISLTIPGGNIIRETKWTIE